MEIKISYLISVIVKHMHTKNNDGIRFIRSPLTSSSDGGPACIFSYNHSLNHIEFTSGIGGPICGGTQLLTDRIS